MKDISKTRIQMGETAATITCEERFVSAVVEGIAKARAEIKSFAGNRQDFLLSLEPLSCGSDAPLSVRRMCAASAKAGVGPMATVAGTIALSGAEHAVNEGAVHCIVDNGGDIAMIIDRPVTVGILEGFSSGTLPAIELKPTDGKIVGLCTSSGRYGQSISFGKAQAATVMADDPPLADAVATALGNLCRSEENIKEALDSISSIEGIIWAMAIVDGKVGTLGEVPKLVTGKASREAVTVHSGFPASIPLD